MTKMTMNTITTRDGASIFYKDWGAGPPIVFSHGWPLSADAWDIQMVFFGERGYRVIAHDRRGHGRSSQTWNGNDMNTYADDLAELIEVLDLHDAVLVGHSTGGGEVVRYLGRHGTERVAKVALVSAVPPLLLKTDGNPDGVPMALFDELRRGIAQNRSQYFREMALPFYGYNRQGAVVSQGIVDGFWLQATVAGMKCVLDCVAAFSETDFHEDLKRIDVPLLLVHGDDDQIVPIGISSKRTVQLVPGATLRVIAGAPHGLATTHHDVLDAELLRFVRQPASATVAATSEARSAPASTDPRQ